MKEHFNEIPAHALRPLDASPRDLERVREQVAQRLGVVRDLQKVVDVQAVDRDPLILPRPNCVVGEDWQRAGRCLTRCFAVLVERRVVGEMAIFANHHNQVTAATHYPIRSSASFRPPRPTGYPTLVAYIAPLRLSPSTANHIPYFPLFPSTASHSQRIHYQTNQGVD